MMAFQNELIAAVNCVITFAAILCAPCLILTQSVTDSTCHIPEKNALLK